MTKLFEGVVARRSYDQIYHFDCAEYISALELLEMPKRIVASLRR